MTGNIPANFIPNVTTQSGIIPLLIALQPIRDRRIDGTTSPWVFFELKEMFQLFESWASAYIEGNHTQIADLVEASRQGSQAFRTDAIKEIENIDKGIDHIEALLKSGSLEVNKELILDLHRIVVDGLDPSPNKGGDTRPGAYRIEPRTVGEHDTLAWADVPGAMDKLFGFINEATTPEYDLLKIAVVHHRFVWIHPFGNGNGRMVRLVTYAMLAKTGFVDRSGFRLLDPTAVLGKNKTQYCAKLAGADSGTEAGLLDWSEYMLQGIKDEWDKIVKLLDEEFVRNNIILPALTLSLEKQRISDLEYKVLEIAAKKPYIRAGDIDKLFTGTSGGNRSNFIRRMKQQNLLRPMGGEHARTYTLQFTRNALTSGIVTQLDKHGFLPPIQVQ